MIGDSATVPDYDLHRPLLSLPNACRVGCPVSVPHSQAPAQAAQRWAMRETDMRPRVGVVWAGSRGHVDDRNRSMRLEQLMPLLALPASFWSLQKDVPEADAGTCSIARTCMTCVRTWQASSIPRP